MHHVIIYTHPKTVYLYFIKHTFFIFTIRSTKLYASIIFAHYSRLCIISLS